ncbi:hypothetical protein K491DRAFT_679238 [Lophiostoma macrostomum CBS 122681]|uniref:Uncharacterized protein n=1 Tax=Lophiostoma macrostomum CBS 122681 TaxID=1314788 RepID=A0A6A6T6T8_9PLEO|nr:hypothetical protein K491DRAFT_679238 [Lophiostoma macrostomum CBS 122681]
MSSNRRVARTTVDESNLFDPLDDQSLKFRFSTRALQLAEGIRNQRIAAKAPGIQQVIVHAGKQSKDEQRQKGIEALQRLRSEKHPPAMNPLGQLSEVENRVLDDIETRAKAGLERKTHSLLRALTKMAEPVLYRSYQDAVMHRAANSHQSASEGSNAIISLGTKLVQPEPRDEDMVKLWSAAERICANTISPAIGRIHEHLVEMSKSANMINKFFVLGLPSLQDLSIEAAVQHVQCRDLIVQYFNLVMVRWSPTNGIVGRVTFDVGFYDSKDNDFLRKKFLPYKDIFEVNFKSLAGSLLSAFGSTGQPPREAIVTFNSSNPIRQMVVDMACEQLQELHELLELQKLGHLKPQKLQKPKGVQSPEERQELEEVHRREELEKLQRHQRLEELENLQKLHVPGLIICAPPLEDIIIEDPGCSGDRTSFTVLKFLSDNYTGYTFTTEEMEVTRISTTGKRC